MAGIADTFENDLMKLIFQAVDIANIADDAVSAPITDIEYSLHTADPTDSGDQTSSEITYTSYAREPVARTAGGHAVSANSISPVANVDFTPGTGGSGTASFFATGTANTGAGKILWYGTVAPGIVTGDGVTPRLTTATAMTID